MIAILLVGCHSTVPGDKAAEGYTANVRFTYPAEFPVDGIAMRDKNDRYNLAHCYPTNAGGCDIALHRAGDYEVTASSETAYLTPKTLTLAENDNNQDANVSWSLGGCDDPEWSPGDGYCDSWSPGQVSCDFAGSWRGVEDDYRDYEADIEMDYIDSDGDGQYEVVLSGNTPFTTSVNGSGTWFYHGVEDSTLTSGEVVDLVEGDYLPSQSCDDLRYVYFYRVNGSGTRTNAYHIERE